ncbi:MAG: isoprenyl transferase [Candidatus Izemoplasmatales bacterium]|jgi:undecaprenyl diphosphate synthase|nr:isoprenyl transferase [Candidatus Izemoplasmatales bacterium]
MKKVKLDNNLIIPEHIAIILDGNGRWAKKRKMPRTYGHQRGVENIRTIAIAASNMGIKALSVYAFSTENWSRPKAEVDFLMKLPGEFEKRFKDEFKKHDIKVMFSGRKTHLSQENLTILERITENTKDRKGLILNICFDYGSRTEIIEAVKLIAQDVLNGKTKIDEITESNIENYLYTKDLPKLDLLIRPSGEIRLSNFLLWQAAYAELYFCETYWPAFSQKDLEKAIIDFSKRERRFGGLKDKE